MYWEADTLMLLDQRALPHREEWLPLRTWQQVAVAIRDMAVRGAPAIGVAAAYGLALAAKKGEDLERAAQGLLETRPTAVNLRWAIERITALNSNDPDQILKEAQKIEREDVEQNLAIGKHGAALLPEGARVLTVCNTGSLATAGHGTALGIIRTAHEQGKLKSIFVCETRPRQQGLRLTTWELLADKIPFQVIADGAAGWLMKKAEVDAVITGADRIAANGDTANKIGTYSLAVLAKEHGIPFIVAAPTSTVDPRIPDGSKIPIEERPALEITHIEGVAVAPDGCEAYNPAFDVTPGKLISKIVTEQGVNGFPYSFQMVQTTVLTSRSNPSGNR